MATNTKTPQDSDYYDRTKQMYERELQGNPTAAKDQRDSFENEFGGDNYEQDAPTSGSAIAAAKQQEETPDAPVDNGFYRPGKGQKQQKITAKNFFKKKGPMATIIAILLGGGAGFSFLLAPGLGIVQLKEILTDDLNDQLAAMDIRTDKVLLAKMKGLQTGASFCSNTINIRCKFSTMSGGQVEKFQNAQFDIECDSGNPCKMGKFARNKITKITFPDGEEFTRPNEAMRHARTNAAAASAMRQAYNPKFAGFADNVANKVFKNKLGVSKKPVITSGTPEENDENVKNAVLQGNTDETRASVPTSGETEDERAARESANQLGSEMAEQVEQAKESDTKISSSMLSGAIKGFGILGAADSACTLYRTTQAVAAGAKAIRSIQLARYAMNFLSVADAIKAGDATPEQVEYVGNILTETDSRKKIPDPDKPNVMIDNPFYGKSAFDSPGYKVAAYNEAPNLTARSGQYTVGGSGGVLALLAQSTDITNKLGADPRTTCDIIQNPITRAGGLIVGVIAGIFSGGSSILASVTASAAFGFAIGLAEAMLVDILAGNVISDSTKGVEAGDAMFAGTASVMGNVAQARGLSPLSAEGIEEYASVQNNTRSDRIAIETYEAKDTPFDISNQYSFLGSLSRSLATTIRSSNSTLTTLSSIITKPFSLLGNTASAQSEYNPERFTKCEDPVYESMGYAPDVFCNLRFGLTQEELNMDTDTVIDFMIGDEQGGKYIDEVTGEPKGDYEKYVQYCIDRTDPFGPTGEEGDKFFVDGTVCSDQSEIYQNFRVYTIDKSIQEGMEDEVEVTEEEAPTNPSSENSGEVSPDGWAFPTTAGAPISGSTFSFGHPGIDIGIPGSDVPIYSVRDGVVVSSGDITLPYIPIAGGQEGSVQQVVSIRHNVNGEVYYSSYHHVAMNSITVSVGDTVKAGDRIATMGNTGYSFDQHLHFELYKGGYTRAGSPPGTAVDPTPLFY